MRVMQADAFIAECEARRDPQRAVVEPAAATCLFCTRPPTPGFATCETCRERLRSTRTSNEKAWSDEDLSAKEARRTQQRTAANERFRERRETRESASEEPEMTPRDETYVCDLCDPPRAFTTSQVLGVHRFRAHDVRAEKKPKRPAPVDSAPAPADPIGELVQSCRDAASEAEDFNADEPVAERDCPECGTDAEGFTLGDVVEAAHRSGMRVSFALVPRGEIIAVHLEALVLEARLADMSGTDAAPAIEARTARMRDLLWRPMPHE